jgi:hypothetical protein
MTEDSHYFSEEEDIPRYPVMQSLQKTVRSIIIFLFSQFSLNNFLYFFESATVAYYIFAL